MENQRSAYRYAMLLRQFHVAEAPRYKPHRASGEKDTYCNVFVLDVARNMHADLLEVLEDKDQVPLAKLNTTVNNIAKGLTQLGEKHGWHQVDWRQAQQMADAGRPTVALWENPKPEHHGHIAMVRPGSVDDPRGVAIAQSGNFTVDASHLKDRFAVVDQKTGTKTPLTPVEYWYHD
jgi:hypothetical protein